jgi:hypothetical protein
LYFSAGRTLETVGKKFPGLWKLFQKVSKILEAVGHGVQKFGQSLNNFGIIVTNRVSSAGWKQRIVNNGAMVQKSSFQICFFLQSSATQLLSVKKLTFWR